MATRKVSVRTARIGAVADKSGIRVHLNLGAPTPHESIEFDIGNVEAERLAKAILKLLPSGSDPARPSRSRAVGKPKLKIVK